MPKEDVKVMFPDLENGEFFTGKLATTEGNQLMVKVSPSKAMVFMPKISHVITLGNAKKHWPVERVTHVKFQSENGYIHEVGDKKRSRKVK
jgi:hypothetical protein